MNEQLVSIVIPTFNCAHFLSRALESVMNQTYTNWEALVIDNYSIDNTDDVVRSFGDERIKLFKVRNQGVIAVSRNLGICEASGRWVAFLDADDWWKPCKLDLSVQALSKDADFVYHDLLRAGPKSRKFFVRRIIKSPQLASPVYESLIKFGNPILNSSVVVRRDLLMNIGGLSENPRLIAAEDFECWLRVALLTDRFHRLSGAYGYYWIGDANTFSMKRASIFLSELRDHYLISLESSREPYNPPWLGLALAVAFYKERNYTACKTELERIWKLKHVTLWTRIKSFSLRLLLLVKLE